MLRVVQAVQPAWVVGENVKGHVTLGLDEVIDDLERAGYAARAFVFPACAIGANHKRERCFVVGHSRSKLVYARRDEVVNVGCPDDEEGSGRKSAVCRPVACSGAEVGGGGWWAFEPGVGRVVDGFPGRMDRLRALGNAVVPQQAYPIFAAIAETYNV
jgi:DNA (cytosine-5)-methyltransferase 1